MQESGMSNPEYIAPDSLAVALKIKQEHAADVRVIAGGTDLILRMRDRVYSPKLLLDLRRISLDTISMRASEMRLGAYVTLSQILADEEIAVSFPALAEACRQFAGPPIRNRGTLGGNLVNASPAADLAPPLMAYDTSIVLASSTGERALPLADFITGPGQTVIQTDEILTEIRIPLMPPTTTSRFIKLGQRRSMAISIINLSTRLTLDAEAKVSAARIVLGAVAPTPMHAVSAEAVLVGNELSDDRIALAAMSASEEISPITDVRASSNYRERMTRVLVRRALLACWDDLERSESSD